MKINVLIKWNPSRFIVWEKNKLFKFFVTILPNLWGIRSSSFNVKSLVTSIYFTIPQQPLFFHQRQFQIKSCCTRITFRGTSGSSVNKCLWNPCLHLTPCICCYSKIIKKGQYFKKGQRPFGFFPTKTSILGMLGVPIRCK